jgi:putative Mg2+ transporter-C (MgtC) family protein
MLELALAELTAGLPDANQLVRAALRLFAAAVCGAIIGLQREHLGKPAGLRTHMLVATGTALFLVAAAEAGLQDEALSRVIQGLVTGIGFLGAGSILKLEHSREIKGLTTAADIWFTAAAGVAAGLGRLGLAVLATGLAWVVLAVLVRVEGGIKRDPLQPAEDKPGVKASPKS